MRSSVSLRSLGWVIHQDVEPISVARALRGGPATLDALSARLGGVDRDALLWAVGDARDRGYLTGGEALDCGPDGLCGTGAPPVYHLTAAGRSAC